MAGKTRDATVSFFEIRDKNGEPLATSIDWPGFLAVIARQSAEDRCHPINGASHWGQVYTYDGNDHLILAKWRDEVSSLNVVTGEIVDMASETSRPWVELSVAYFLPGTNRLAYVLGSSAAPRISSLEAWIVAHDLLEAPISIEPMLDRNVIAKINGAVAATSMRVTYEVDKLARVRRSRGLVDAARELNSDFGDVVVEMHIKTDRHHGGHDEQMKMLREAREIAGTDEFLKAKAQLTVRDESGRERKEFVDFVKNRLARKMKIQVTDREGRSIKLASAVQAIYRATDLLKGDLEA